ncbi:D-lactaldehyde dehydrogenase [Fomitiporia mediterranea MF3/22]|uniref:D-lactaldehyde dehydrogenase n=1 Tax=Fomitiporia mediterranea (strain MF3/22) TaxID=694068 RepID=UPI0004408368|nr:D-lactaldehyde dehydrogenase [Fomitiporia mediterranea MF3/22]EJD07759.1 D-lactaldehyde dehydrogenase [Fomitiporia mediterranea MF3/22]
MPAIASPAKVLVSGANGFIAAWVVRTLLDHGYSVRGAVRSASKTTHMHKVFKDEVDNGRLEFIVVPDITAPGAFDEAVKGVDAIEHTASPFRYNSSDPADYIDPAVKGTVGILESAMKHAGPQLKRVVVTSSVAAVHNPDAEGLQDESNWNEGSIANVREKGKDASLVDMYCASKSLAEKAAFDFVARNSVAITWDLATICPPFVFGPNLNEVHSPSDLGTSQAVFYEALLSKAKTLDELADFWAGWVDVRDVALGHVRALEVPEAGSQRFIMTSGSFVWQDWLDAANALDMQGLDVPKGKPGSGKTFKYKFTFDSTKARNVLGIQFRDKLTTARDTIEDFRSRGW